jgi:DNA-binding MarR family transcriptional regulator
MVFTMMRKSENFAVSNHAEHFNDTEIRLIGEVLSASYEGKRLISTQLATRLGVTRSAISQIVNNLERRGVIQRVPAEDDKKIAYVELTENAIDVYQKARQSGVEFVDKLLKEFGQENMDRLLSLTDDFWNVASKICGCCENNKI